MASAASIEERLIELINSASVEIDNHKKVEFLYQIKELALNHGLVNNFFQDILAFQNGSTPNVKKVVLAFIEAACRYDCKLCPKAVISLNLLLNDTNTEVIKRSIQAATQIYRALVNWLKIANDGALNSQQATQNLTIGDATSVGLIPNSDDLKALHSEIEHTWLIWLQISQSIYALLETTNNDGIRTHCIKFIETAVLLQTPRDKFTEPTYELNLIDPVLRNVELSGEVTSLNAIEGLPRNRVLFNQEHKLELVEAAKRRFEQLVRFHGTSHISSVNLMATMQSLVVLAKQRYRLFMGRVIQAMESLHSRLPPTLTESQVQSVKKFLKLQLTVMLKHPYSLDRFQHQITQLLQAVGSRQPEINRVINDFKQKIGNDVQAHSSDFQKRIKLEPGLKQTTIGSGPQTTITQPQPPPGKSKHLDLNKLTQELDEKEKRQIVVDSVRRILAEEKTTYISPAQMEIKKKVLSTLANEFHNTECPNVIQDYIFADLKNRHEIAYAIIRKHYDVAAAKASKRQINLLDHQELLKKYFDCFNSYLSRAMDTKEEKEKNIILPNLYALRAEYYKLSNPYAEDDEEQQQHVPEQELEQVAASET